MEKLKNTDLTMFSTKLIDKHLKAKTALLKAKTAQIKQEIKSSKLHDEIYRTTQNISNNLKMQKAREKQLKNEPPLSVVDKILDLGGR